jgi:hypothetical protein
MFAGSGALYIRKSKNWKIPSLLNWDVYEKESRRHHEFKVFEGFHLYMSCRVSQS